jgi:hypothetical protein
VLLLSTFLLLSVGGDISNGVSPLTNGTKLYVDPLLTSQPIGSNFTIEIRLNNVTDLFGFDLQFSWDPAVLDYVDHTAKVPVTTFPDGLLYETILWLKNDVNSVAGTYWIAATSFAPAPSFNGSGIVFNMTFDVIAEGVSGLNFLSDDLADTDGKSIPHQTINGTFDNRPASGQLVVRGTDDGVWYRSFDGVDWGGWGGLGGLTHDVPAAAVFGEKLHVVVNGTDGALWWCSIGLDGSGFSGWQAISGYGIPVLTSTIPIP